MRTSGPSRWCRGAAWATRLPMLVALPMLAALLAGAGCGSDETYLPSAGAGSGGAGHEPAAGGAAGAAGSAGQGEPEPEVASPELDGILVEGVEVGLKPAFAPGTLRYSVLASDPAQTVVVTASAAPEFEIRVDGRRAESDDPVELPDAEPGSEIEIEVRNSLGKRRVYTLVYLPFDFPDISVTTHEPEASSYPIYLAPRASGHFYVAKLNANGVPLFYKKLDNNADNFRKHPNGQFSYSLQRDDEDRWVHVVLDENFEEVTRVTTVGLFDTDPHEFQILPNGHYIVLSYEKTVHDLTEFGRGSAVTLVDAILQELSPDREVLFQWNSWDHFSYGDSVYEKSDADYSHINSVFVDTDGNWILSSRGMAQILKIDRTTGEVLWRLGGKTNEFTFIDDPFSGLCGQHTVTRLPNGHLLAFDNGQSCWPEVPERGDLTRIVEYAIDEQAKTAKLVFTYDREGAYTVSQGSAQRLDNGNTVIGWGLGFTQLLTEVDPEGNIVFELGGRILSVVATSYRVYRFPD